MALGIEDITLSTFCFLWLTTYLTGLRTDRQLISRYPSNELDYWLHSNQFTYYSPNQAENQHPRPSISIAPRDPGTPRICLGIVRHEAAFPAWNDTSDGRWKSTGDSDDKSDVDPTVWEICSISTDRTTHLLLRVRYDQICNGLFDVIQFFTRPNALSDILNEAHFKLWKALTITQMECVEGQSRWLQRTN
jgi:hypothetical protein